MKYLISLVIILLFNTALFSQGQDCGYKTECVCDTLNASVADAYGISDFVIAGSVHKIDTISIAEIIHSDSAQQIQQDSLPDSACAKSVLAEQMVLAVEIEVEEAFKGGLEGNSLYVVTPLKESSCHFSGFTVGQHFIVYGTDNTTADIYFTWTLDRDFFYLKPAFRSWTNQCKRTGVANAAEMDELREIVKAGKN